MWRHGEREEVKQLVAFLWRYAKLPMINELNFFNRGFPVSHVIISQLFTGSRVYKCYILYKYSYDGVHGMGSPLGVFAVASDLSADVSCSSLRSSSASSCSFCSIFAAVVSEVSPT